MPVAPRPVNCLRALWLHDGGSYLVTGCTGTESDCSLEDAGSTMRPLTCSKLADIRLVLLLSDLSGWDSSGIVGAAEPIAQDARGIACIFGTQIAG